MAATAPSPASSSAPSRFRYAGGGRRRLNLLDQGVGPIYDLVTEVGQYLLMPPPYSSGPTGALIVLMGAMAGNMIAGYPCWPVFLGPPSVGKSETLNLTLGIPGVFECADPTSKAAFLSGTSKKERARDATGGILQQIGAHGAMVISDLTSIISNQENVANQIVGVLRECHGGRYSRPAGVDGGKTLKWRGRLAVFGGCTNILESYADTIQSMGERWLFYRLDDDETVGWAKGRTALDNITVSGWQQELRSIVAAFFECLDLKFNQDTGETEAHRELTAHEKTRLQYMAQLCVAARSHSIRDKRTREITVPPERESASRLLTSLGQLLLGLDIIGCEPRLTWDLIGKVAIDSMPLARKMTLEFLLDRQEPENGAKPGATITEIINRLQISQGPVERMLEDLQIYRVIDKVLDPEGGKTRYTTSRATAEAWRLGWGR